MPLVTSAAYPVDRNMDEGLAVLELRSPGGLTGDDLAGGALASAARAHAGSWEAFARELEALMAGGWSLQQRGCVYAMRRARAADLRRSGLPGLADRTPVHWCTADEAGALVAVGGYVVGCEASRELLPQSTLPALVENHLTGRQRISRTKDDLRSYIREELSASAGWWRTHPAAMSDHDTHGLPDELDALAEALARDPLPALVAEDASARRILRDGPTTRVVVHPVSAVVFAGLLEAANRVSLLSLAPYEGVAADLRARGAALARELGLFSG